MERAHSDSSEEIAMLRRMLAERDAALASAAIEIEHLRLQLQALKRSQFGRSSEKLDAEIDQLELRLEDLEENEAERIATIPTKAVSEHQYRAVAVRKPLPDHLRARSWCTNPRSIATAASAASSASLARMRLRY